MPNCPLCGQPGYLGAWIFECNTKGCANFKEPKQEPITLNNVDTSAVVNGTDNTTVGFYGISPQPQVIAKYNPHKCCYDLSNGNIINRLNSTGTQDRDWDAILQDFINEGVTHITYTYLRDLITLEDWIIDKGLKNHPVAKSIKD